MTTTNTPIKRGALAHKNLDKEVKPLSKISPVPLLFKQQSQQSKSDKIDDACKSDSKSET
jgi:hypothetical protein